jgi:hypothetical protein
MDDQYTWTLSKIEDINCKRPAKDRFFEIQELLCPETFSIKILQFVKKFKLGSREWILFSIFSLVSDKL